MIGFGGNSCSGISSMDMMMDIDDDNNNNNNNNRKVIPSMAVVSSNQNRRVSVLNMAHHQNHHNSNTNTNNNTCSNSNSVRDKIMAHPLFPRLLSSYLNCLKVGAPPEVVARLEELSAKCESSSSSIHQHQHHHDHVSDHHKMSNGGSTIGSGIGEVDPGLDQFMEAYCEMLIKYEQELTKPFKEAMLFFSRIESQLKALSLSSSTTLDHFGNDHHHHHHHHHQSESSACLQYENNNSNEIDENKKKMMMMESSQILSEERELKIQLLRKYSGYLGGLKKEFLKKKKNGKLPKEARHQLLDWWNRHYKWPYPSESQKQALAETTGLDLKQINNWFINQRKRHWKPSEDMQFAVMDATNHYIETIMCKPFPIDAMPILF